MKHFAIGISAAVLLVLSACSSPSSTSSAPVGDCCKKTADLKAQVPKCCAPSLEPGAPLSECCKASKADPSKKADCCKKTEEIMAQLPECCKKAAAGEPQACCTKK